MNNVLNIAAIIVVLAALLLAFLRRRDVALPWWIDWLGASATPIIAAISGLMAGRWLFGRDVEPPKSETTQNAPENSTPPMPRPDPPTNDVEEIIADSNEQLKQEPDDDIHEQLHDELSKYLD